MRDRVHRAMQLNVTEMSGNMLPTDAKELYAQSEVGDVVDFVHADGPTMTAAAGLGDWNVPWTTWQRGGAVPTR